MKNLKKPQTPLWVTTRTARELVGISARSLNLLRKAGLVQAKKINPLAKSPRWLYRYSDLDSAT